MKDSTTSTEAYIASMEASNRFHGSAGSFHGSCGSFHGSDGSFHGSRLRGSFHLQGNSLPCAMEASVEAVEATTEAVESFHFLWDWELLRTLPVEASVKRSSSTYAEASKELRSLPRASMWLHLHQLTSTSSHKLRRASTSSSDFHVLPPTSPNLHAALLSSMKGKQIEACTEGSKMEDFTEGSGSSWNFHCITGSLQ